MQQNNNVVNQGEANRLASVASVDFVLRVKQIITVLGLIVLLVIIRGLSGF